jgi:outer membrane protein assembly factor BamE (lipoprotein component of BamABCDE complex)
MRGVLEARNRDKSGMRDQWMRNSLNSRRFQGPTARTLRRIVAITSFSLLSAGCLATTYQRGYVFDQASLDQVPVGASQEQVLLVLGTPSTVATVSGEVFYYISQRTERKAAFLNPQVVDQRVLAVYFDPERRVGRVANYGVQDGKIFDFVSRTTPTGGEELSFLRQIFGNLLGLGRSG